MKALILKDMYVLLNQKKILMTLILIFVIVSFFLGDPGLLITFLTVLCIAQVVTSISSDETSQWNRFANTLPIKKADIVKSKYVISLLFISMIVFISLPVLLITNIISKSFTANEVFSVFSLIIAGMLFVLSVLLPVFIKFGSQTGRFVFAAFIFIPIIGLNVLSNSSIMDDLYEILHSFSFFIPFLAIMMYFISFKLSVKFYEKKEF